MAELPVELFQAIAKDVGDDPSIFNLRLVSKNLNSVVTPFAFRVVVVCDTVKSATAVSFLQGCDESITSLVHEVIFKGDSANQKPGRWANETSGETGREAVRAVFAGLAKFPKLEHLRCDFHDCYQESTNFMSETPTHFLRLQLGIFSTLAAHPPPPLASLSLTNVLAIPNPIYAQPDFQRVFHSLQRLDISILSDADFEGSYFQEPLVEFWEQSVPSMLRGARSTLTSLTLRSDQPTGSCPRLPFTDVSFPHLTSLALHNFCLIPTLPESDVVVAFILQHKATLARLELHGCSIDGDFSRPWFAVLALFEAELSSLSEFVFENDPQFEYTRLDAGWGYMPWEEEIAGQEQDLPALERLMAVVNSRQKGN
ncbi:hypothetical protein C8R46DRAFT_1059128 [Mycena filopes]|nr:hypothetical protein C8R46DRAFT_1059128 [Mycena filopes]